MKKNFYRIKYEEDFKDTINWLLTVLYTIIFAFFVIKILVINLFVPSSSMENTIFKKDRLISNRMSYIFKSPKRFDIVVFKYPDNKKELYIKRIIGLPGEEIQIIDGDIFINGKKLIYDDCTKEGTSGDFPPFIIAKDNYFMIGDNRNGSKDSREWKNTTVIRKDILGKVIFRYYPNFTFFKKINEWK